MKFMHLYQRQIEWAGIVAFVVAFWSTFVVSACVLFGVWS
jgi:hypothetical protein